jgi:zinc protease
MRILVLLAIVGTLSGADVAKGAPAAPATVISVPKLAYTARTLSNGARIYAIRDASAPSVSVNIWYDVGQRDDPKGRGGFAHLFEHLMFKATRNIPGGILPFVTDRGGQSNASTLFDYTNYYVTAPANQLEALLWLEGERLQNLVVDEAAFNSERKVVQEELRQRIFAQPYGRILYTLLPAFTFDTHPYRRPIGGTIEDLDKASLADVRAFHEAYYRPDNAIFVISGNFEPAKLNAWVDRYLGSIPRPKATIARDTATERAPLRARTVDAYVPNVPLPALIFSWRAPGAGDPDTPGMSVIEALLTRGSSSRLRRRLVDELQLASNVSSFNLASRDGHAFALIVTLAQGRELGDAEAAFAAEIRRLRDEPVGEEELQAVKNGLLGQALSSRETVLGRAYELGEGVALTGDPALADRELQAIRALTPNDVQRIARRRLSDSARVTIRYQDESKRPAGYRGDDLPDVSAMGTIVPPAAKPPVIAAVASQAERPPAPGPIISRNLPMIAQSRLSNGLRIVAAKSTSIPLVTLKLIIPGGDAADPAGKAGLADVTAALAQRGAGGRDAAAIAQAVAGLGGSLSTIADPDATIFTLNVPAANAEAGGRILSDLVLRPSFAEIDLDRVRKQQSDALSVASRQPMQTALRLLPAAMLRGSAYGGVPSAASLAAIARDDVLAAHRRWTPAGSTLVVTGALTQAEARALGERLFGEWKGEAPAETGSAPVAAATPQVLVVDIPSAGQAAVLAGLPVAGRADAGWPALRVLNARLGSGFQSFLSQEIRVKRGLSYGAGSLFDARRKATILLAATQTANESADQVVGIILEQIRRLASEPMNAEDIAERTTFLTNALANQTERTAGLADYLASLVETGTPLDAAERELGGEAPDVAQTGSVAAQYFLSPAPTIGVAGDSRKWLDTLRGRFPQLVVVKADGTPAR